MLTLQQVGATGIKLLGVTFLARTVLGGFSLLAVRFAPAGIDGANDVFVAQVVSILGYPVVAWLLLGTADDLASRLFPAVPLPAGFSTRDLLVTGVALLGLSMAVSALPAPIQGLGIAIYYAEAMRQQFAEARFEREWPEFIREALTLATGLAVAASSKPLVARLGGAPTDG